MACRLQQTSAGKCMPRPHSSLPYHRRNRYRTLPPALVPLRPIDPRGCRVLSTVGESASLAITSSALARPVATTDAASAPGSKEEQGISSYRYLLAYPANSDPSAAVDDV
ncbi:uncharacterized protein PFL1_01075 [Pseudozyma flocculosa PF-1]|uniref:uncharacterized protein n=1 Tax=Pseudozyma flocculosa PF-1 TaxID=1277687 RepID=UPI00045613D0|nr:uncharacterized protein PFL1_01075 [Pseudozyma flocculosa PF-1]EPQ31743.1 hypothetical protein PFL1_01075 [Pseudozyma flocculosa PF-1]